MRTRSRRPLQGLFAAVAVILSLYVAVHAIAAPTKCHSWSTNYDQLVSSDTNDKVITVRHRGSFNEVLPENSIGAFVKAFEECRPHVETDVRLTKDNELVLLHDMNVGRVMEPEYDPETQKGPNELLRNLTLSEVRAKHLVRTDRTETHYTITTVRELIQKVLDLDATSIIHLEIKEGKAIIPTAKMLDEYNKKYPGKNILKRFLIKFTMHEYRTPQEWKEALMKEGITSDFLMMPMINPKLAKAIDEGPQCLTFRSLNCTTTFPGLLRIGLTLIRV